MLYGIILSSIITTATYLIKYLFPSFPIGSVSLALVAGILLGNMAPFLTSTSTKPGIKFVEKRVLELAIVLMGLKLNFSYLFKLGPQALTFILISITFTIVIAPQIGRLFTLKKDNSLLIGVGNAVCGSSAIAAFNPVLGASSIKMGLAIGVINFLGTLGIFIIPFLSKILHYSDLQSSFLIGGTLQAVGHVAAAGFSLGDKVGESAILIKMFRILMIGPIVISFSLYKSRTQGGKLTIPKLPLFIIGFIATSIITSYLGTTEVTTQLLHLSKVLLTAAMAAIGLNISFKELKNEGTSMLYTGGSIFLLQIIIAITLISILKIS